MEIREMTIDDIETRCAAIKEEMTSENADLDALTAEVSELETRKAELKKAAEERAAQATKIAEGAGTVERNLKEETTMETKKTVDELGLHMYNSARDNLDAQFKENTEKLWILEI